MKKVLIAFCAIFFMVSIGQAEKPHVLVTLQTWPKDNSHSLQAYIETSRLTGFKSKRSRIWVNTNEIFCEIKVGGAIYSVYASSIGKDGYLVQFYQSPESGGSITDSLIVPIRKPFPRGLGEAEAKNSQGTPYRIRIFYSSNKKEIDFLSKFYKKDGLFPCKIKLYP